MTEGSSNGGLAGAKPPPRGAQSLGGIPALAPTTAGGPPSRSVSPRPPSPYAQPHRLPLPALIIPATAVASFIVVKDLETILVDQSVLTAAEEQAAGDRVLPSIGLLLGSAPPDSGCCVVKGLVRMPRCVAAAPLVQTAPTNHVLGIRSLCCPRRPSSRPPSPPSVCSTGESGTRAP